MTHPTSRMPDDVHQRVRLGVLAILNGASRADFRYLKDALGVTDGNLSRHIRVLEDAGLVEVIKEFEDRRPRTWVKITKEGRTAFSEEITALRDLIDWLDEPATKPRIDLRGSGVTSA